MAKPLLAADYEQEDVDLIVSAALHVATVLGDLMGDLTIIGGLVPTLLFLKDVGNDEEDADPHCGSTDLDIAIAVALLDDSKYREISDRLRGAGFEHDTNSAGNPTPQRWTRPGMKVTIDFLIGPLTADDQGGRIKHLEEDFGAVIAPGAELAFVDREVVRLEGSTLIGDKAERDVWVAGPAAFAVLKGLAFHLRNERKDAYDLYYVLRRWPGGVEDIAQRLVGLREHDSDVVDIALANLADDFQSIDHLGPRAVARFVSGNLDDNVQADAFSVVADLLSSVAKA